MGRFVCVVEFAVGFVFVSVTRGLLGDEEVKKLSRVRFLDIVQVIDEGLIAIHWFPVLLLEVQLVVG